MDQSPHRSTRPIKVAQAFLACALLSAALSAGAGEVRLHGPNGASGDSEACPEATSVEADEVATTPVTAPARRRDTTHPGKAKAAPMVRSSGETTARPRWHSILPGMFR